VSCRGGGPEGIAVVAVADRVELSPVRLAGAAFAAAHSLAELEPDRAVHVARAAELPEAAGGQIEAGLT
jgi:hypothetical protein